MPYIIKLKRREEDQSGVTVSRVVAQYAVMTLDESEIKRRLFHWREGDALDTFEQRVLDVIKGRAFNPIFDGTVVHVDETTYDDLIATGLECPSYVHPHGWAMAPSSIRRPAIIEAFNQEHS